MAAGASPQQYRHEVILLFTALFARAERVLVLRISGRDVSFESKSRQS